MPGHRIKLSSPMRRRRLISSLLLALGLLAALAAAVERFQGAGDDWTRFDHQSFPVVKVVDGDTIDIRSPDGLTETRVRLIGIDAPEAVDPTTGKPAHWADRSTAYLTARLGVRNVTLRLEPVETRDRYRRLLAYIYLTDGDCINIDMVRNGQAYADRRFMHSWRAQYEQAENEARKKERGLWAGLTELDMPPWRRVWLHERSRDR